MGISIILFIALLFTVCSALLARRRMAVFYTRSCFGRIWRRRFPNAQNDEIREFLHLFVEALALDRKKILSFSPDDRVMDIYRANHESMTGSLEDVAFLMDCEERYGMDISERFSSTSTLGEIFDAVRRRG